MPTDNFTLSRRDLIKITVLTLLLPLPINWALIHLNPLAWIEGANDVPTWIRFGGNYIGGIISILILNKTLQQTGVLHHDLKVLQLNTIVYTQQQDWLSGFKRDLTDNLKAIDLYVLNTVVSSMATQYYAYAKDLLTDINKNLEYQIVISSFSFASSKLSLEEAAYMDLVHKVQMEYSSFIKDILFYIPLVEMIAGGNELGYDTLMDYTLTQYDYLQEQSSTLYEPKKNMIAQVMDIHPCDPVHKKLQSIMEQRLTNRAYLYHLKSDLAEATHRLIAYEENKINAILHKS